HKVTILDDLSTGSLNNIENFRNNRLCEFVEGSVLDQSVLAELATDANIIFHLAAAVGVELVVKDPVYTIETNVHGTENVFACAEKTNTRVVMASTSEVYGRADRPLFCETDDLIIGPPTLYRWSYAASKALDEYLALAYYKEQRLQPVIVRMFNTVGPRQTGEYGMVVPRFIEQALAEKPITVYGDGNQSRCFCHVRDCVRALRNLADSDEAYGGIFNVGSNESVTINELAYLIKRITGSSSEIVHIPYDEAYDPGFEDMYHRAPDTAKIKALTGWQPEFKLKEIIEDSIRYLKDES
ncbi:MAG: NAD-dependent epimerase/dehydratase family protein, partial [Verrucomicrobiota bacterium]